MARIGILAVQGAFIEHEKMLTSLGCDCVELREAQDIKDLDGLVLPGGESTVQGRLLHELGMFDPLQALIRQGLPTLATCAGLILLAEHLSNDDNVYFGTLPVTVRRNAYGRQLGSFRTQAAYDGLGEVDMTFIRAPYIEKAGPRVEIMAQVEGKIVAARWGNQTGLAFHPELGADSRIHQQFLQQIK